MTHVGAMGGTLDLVPMSSSIITRMYSQLAADADTRPSANRSMMKLAVLAYHAWPALTPLVGRCAGHVHLTAPSACSWIWPSFNCGFWCTISAVSPTGASFVINSRNSKLVLPYKPACQRAFYLPYLDMIATSAPRGKPLAHSGGVHITFSSRSAISSGRSVSNTISSCTCNTTSSSWRSA